MSRRIDCPSCGQTLVLDNAPSGRSVRCPACDTLISAKSLGRSEGIATAPQPRGAAPRRSESAEPARRRSQSGAPRGGSMVGLILGIIALVLGVGALTISWVPLLCVLGLITAGIGLLVGVAGIALAAMNQNEGMGISIAGGSVNLVALLLAIFMTFVSGALMGALSDVAEDEDQDKTNASRPQEGGGNPPAGWGQKVDPDNDCTFTTQGANLTITVPPTAHDLSTELGLTNAPRVLQEVTGDFTIQVKVCNSLQPMAPGSVPGRVAFQAGGLLVWSDDSNYLRLERAGINRDGARSSYTSLELRANGVPRGAHTMNLPDQDTYFRLERRGNEFQGFISSDGQNWRPHQRINAPFPAKVQVGVAVVNAAQQQLPVRFEGLQLNKK